MGFTDGFMFWLGKAAAEFAIGAAVLFGFLVFLLIVTYIGRTRK